MKKLVLMGTFLAVTVFGLFGAASAQRDEAKDTPNPIDSALEKCLAGKHATMPRAECFSTAEEAWEKDVKDIYPKVLQALPPKLLPSFKSNQLAWESYRNSQEQFYAAKSAGQKGTGYIAPRIIQNINIWKPRALFLEGLLETYKN